MQLVTVTCDGCGRDLTTTSNVVDYRLVLHSESKPGYGGGAYTAMGKYPAIDRAHHFCAIGCLDYWRDREKKYAALLGMKWDEWKEQHSTTHEAILGGSPVVSFSTPPNETRNTWEAEARATADREFPLDPDRMGKVAKSA